MAIQKPYDQHPEAYWVISKLTVDKRTQTSAARVDVYTSEADKQSGVPAIHSVIEEWTSEYYNGISDGGIPFAYSLLKAGLLQGGIDV